MTHIIGIDPGLKGAIGVLKHIHEGKFTASVYDIPIMQTGKTTKRNEIDCSGLHYILDHYSAPENRVVVFLEAVHSMPGNGIKQAFVSGHTLGGIKGVVASLGFELHLVTPQKWKKQLGLNKDKELSRATAIRLYPSLVEHLSRKKDSDRAEALLIAHYGKEMLK